MTQGRGWIGCTVAVVALLTAGQAVAQDHYTEGPVWECSAYRTKQGHFDDYMEYLRTNYVVTSAESKKQGLTLDSKIFLKTPASPQDADVLICTLYSSFGKALDFNAADEEKMKAISAKHWATSDQKKQAEMSAKRFEMREFLGTEMYREVTLRPMP